MTLLECLLVFALLSVLGAGFVLCTRGLPHHQSTPTLRMECYNDLALNQAGADGYYAAHGEPASSVAALAKAGILFSTKSSRYTMTLDPKTGTVTSSPDCTTLP